MLYTRLFGKTLRSVPQDIKSHAYALLVRGGYIRPLGQGLYSYLPLGLRVFQNIRKIIYEEMMSLGGQEVLVPFVNPRDIWKKSGRDNLIDKELVRFKDRSNRELVLAPTHEEAMVELVRSAINSYRDLPILLFQFQNKFRDEERTRGGLVRTKEFMMKDAYSFHKSYSDLNNFFPKIFASYQNIFQRCGLDIMVANSDVGFMGGEKAYEFLMPTEWGDDVVIYCPSCGYKANCEIAVGGKQYYSGTLKDLKKKYTPDCTTMDNLSACLDVPKNKLAKTMVYKTRDELVMAVVRADYEVSEEKLSRYLGKPVIGLADNKELKSHGLVPGFVSPMDLKTDMRVVVDDTVVNTANLVFGSNKKNYHLDNVNFGRDFETEEVADIVRIQADDYCLQCGEKLHEMRVMELGNIFKLRDYYSKSMNLCIQDDKGERIFPHMGAYGIGMGRLVSAIVEANHDEKGITWPESIAPFKVFLISIGKSLSVKKSVDKIHDELGDAALLDDRHESPGVKFRDAEILGIPYRIVVSTRNLQKGLVELKIRKTGDTMLVSIEEAIRRIQET